MDKARKRRSEDRLRVQNSLTGLRYMGGERVIPFGEGLATLRGSLGWRREGDEGSAPTVEGESDTDQDGGGRAEWAPLV